MAVEQQVIHSHGSAEQIEERLNQLGAEGWRLQGVSTPVTRKGASFAHSHYEMNRLYIVMSRTHERWQYRCRYLRRPTGPEQDIAALNAEIQAQNREGFSLVQIAHLSCISDNHERPAKGTIAHVCLFEAASGDQ